MSLDQVTSACVCGVCVCVYVHSSVCSSIWAPRSIPALLTFRSGLSTFMVQWGRWQSHDGRGCVWRLRGEPMLVWQDQVKRHEPQHQARRVKGKERNDKVPIFLLKNILVPMSCFFKLFFWASKHLKRRGCFESDFKSGLYLCVGNHPLAIL